MAPAQDLFVGIDVGSSGCRAIAIDRSRNEVARAEVPLPPPRYDGAAVEEDAEEWWTGLCSVLEMLLTRAPRERVRALAVDGTSGTVLVTDAEGRPLAPALLYNDNRAVAEAERIRRLAPRESAAHGTSSGLAKLLWLLPRRPRAAHAHTPADWLSARLTGRAGVSDANNVVKLGWDPVAKSWPDWLRELIPRGLLPTVVEPGTPLGPLAPEAARLFGLSVDTAVIAGTTDSTAAIIATGAHEVGDGITSLGSTLVMKVVSERPLFAPEYGVYSQPYGNHWLVGGGSNAGGAVLRHFFTDEQLVRLEPQLDADHLTGLDYYPLLTPGERFPVSDPNYPPRLTPRPADDALFLQGILEGLTKIEALSYRRLEQLGAPYPRRVLTAGGGSRNQAWSLMRRHRLGTLVERAEHDEAAYGTAILAAGEAI